MKDIDFDELDKAVSSVLSQTPDNAANDSATTVIPDTPETSVNVETTNDSQQMPDTSSDDTTDTEPTSHETETMTTTDSEPVIDAPDDATDMTTSEPAPSLAAKRRGKFMDMMHPSSDMTPGTEISAPESPTIERKVLAPISDDMSSDDSTPAVEDTDTTDAAVVAETTNSEEAPGAVLETPATPELSDTEEAPSDDAVTGAEPAESTDTDTEPVVGQQTPFISDAVVEKRPLGAFGDSEETANEVTEPETNTDDSTVDSVSGLPVSMPMTSSPTPRELQADIVKVEAIDDDAEPDGSAEDQPAEAPMTMGIPTTNSDEPDDSHHLFDTATYHQPLAATAMPSSGIPMWIWWTTGLVVCLVVGGGIGYVLYAGGF